VHLLRMQSGRRRNLREQGEGQYTAAPPPRRTQPGNSARRRPD
jgi:hypothetical protein